MAESWLGGAALRRALVVLLIHSAGLRAGAGAAVCLGDCDADGVVTPGELRQGVREALAPATGEPCASFACAPGQDVTVDCIVRAVGEARSDCGSKVPSPSVEGPVTGGAGVPFIASTMFDLARVGYMRAEYFLSGVARAYAAAGVLGTDGLWAVEPADSAFYKTRILVYRPIDARDFNGTVMVEWLNVSGGLDASPDWTTAHTELIREGYAWVGVSAQKTGVEGGISAVGLPSIPLKTVDPVRYGTLVHPGDSFSYDIFSQAVQSMRRPEGIAPLEDLAVETLLAAGESQSAFRLVTYINAFQPRFGLYDGYLVHSRGAIGAPLSEAPQRPITVPNTAAIRADVDVPVLAFETETDVSLLRYFEARQPDSDNFRLWEVAGTAHADTYTVQVGATDLGDSPAVANILLTTAPVPMFTCARPINSGPQHWVLKAALASLRRWVRGGEPPPVAPRLEAEPGPPIRILRDADGNARGGIRTPQLEVPIATMSGEGQTGSLLCSLFGTTVPFDAAKLASLYPDHETYVSAFNQAADAAVEGGYILPPDAELMKAAAADSDVGA